MPLPPVLSVTVPVLSWYTVQFGNIQVSQILSVPNASYLSSPDGLNPGLVGTADGCIIHLAGFTDTNDGGQNWLMWDAESSQAVDNLTVFNPYPSTLSTGRWIAQLTTAPPASRIIVTGQVIQLGPATIYCAVRKVIPSVTTILLPNMNVAVLGIPVRVKADRQADLFPVTVTTLDGSTIDYLTSDTLNVPLQERAYTPDGTMWNRG